MSDSEKQLTFDFDGFFSDDSKSPVSKPDQVLDPAISEEEEMDEFLREVRSEKQDVPAEESENVLPQEVPELKTESETFTVTETVPEQSIPKETETVSSAPSAENPPAETVQISVTEEMNAEETAADPETSAVPEKERPLNRMQLKRAALAFLASLKPSGLAQNVPTAGGRWRTDTAAFWLEQNKKRSRVSRTVLAEVRTEQEAETECADHAEQLNLLKLAKLQREDLEAEIRRTEPHLLDTGVLFPEIEYWDYEETVNPAYKECLGRIRNYETALYQGSRFERLRRANVANELYLAVPEGLLKPEEVAQGWGLLYVSRKLKISVVKQADRIECPQENMLHLSQNIAASSLNDVLFAHGIGIASNGNVQFRRPPHRRGFRKLNDK